MIRLTRDVVRSWFPKDAVTSSTHLADILEVIIGEFNKDFCLQEILDISFKVYMEDVEHFTINQPFYLIFNEVTSKFNLDLYELTEQCVEYNIPDIRNVFDRYDRLQVTISRVIRFYGSRVDISSLERVLYNTCKKYFPYAKFRQHFECIFKSTVDFFIK